MVRASTVFVAVSASVATLSSGYEDDAAMKMADQYAKFGGDASTIDDMKAAWMQQNDFSEKDGTFESTFATDFAGLKDFFASEGMKEDFLSPEDMKENFSAEEIISTMKGHHSSRGGGKKKMFFKCRQDPEMLLELAEKFNALPEAEQERIRALAKQLGSAISKNFEEFPKDDTLPVMPPKDELASEEKEDAPLDHSLEEEHHDHLHDKEQHEEKIAFHEQMKEKISQKLSEISPEDLELLKAFKARMELLKKKMMKETGDQGHLFDKKHDHSHPHDEDEKDATFSEEEDNMDATTTTPVSTTTVAPTTGSDPLLVSVAPLYGDDISAAAFPRKLDAWEWFSSFFSGEEKEKMDKFPAGDKNASGVKAEEDMQKNKDFSSFDAVFEKIGFELISEEKEDASLLQFGGDRTLEESLLGCLEGDKDGDKKFRPSSEESGKGKGKKGKGKKGGEKMKSADDQKKGSGKKAGAMVSSNNMDESSSGQKKGNGKSGATSSSRKGEGRKGENRASFNGQRIEGSDGNSSKGKGKNGKNNKSRKPKNMKGRLRLGAKVPKGRPETESELEEMKEGFQMTLAETVGVEEDRIIIEDIQFLEEPPVADQASSSNNTTTTYTTSATTTRRLLRGAFPSAAHVVFSRFLQEENTLYTVLVDYVVTFPEEATEEEGADLFTRMTAGETFNEVVRANFHSHGGHMMEVMSVENDGLEMHYGENDRDHDKPFYESRRFIFIAGGAAAVLLLTCVSCYCCSERCLCCQKKRLYKSSGRNANSNANNNSAVNNEQVTGSDDLQQQAAFQATTNAGMINRQLELPTPTYWHNNVAPQPLPTFITSAPVATYTPTYYPQPLAMAPTTPVAAIVDPRQQQALQQQPQPVVVNINNGAAASGERE